MSRTVPVGVVVVPDCPSGSGTLIDVPDCPSGSGSCPGLSQWEWYCSLLVRSCTASPPVFLLPSPDPATSSQPSPSTTERHSQHHIKPLPRHFCPLSITVEYDFSARKERKNASSVLLTIIKLHNGETGVLNEASL